MYFSPLRITPNNSKIHYERKRISRTYLFTAAMRPTRSEIELAFKAIPPSNWICCYVRPPNQQQAPCRSLKGQQFFAIAQEIRNLDGKKVLSGDAVALALSRKVTIRNPVLSRCVTVKQCGVPTLATRTPCNLKVAEKPVQI